MHEHLIHPIEYDLMKTPKTVINLLDEHYNREDIEIEILLQTCDPRNYTYIKHLAAVTLSHYSPEAIEQSIRIAGRAFHFASTVGMLAGLDDTIIQVDRDFLPGQDLMQAQQVVAERSDLYINQNGPTKRLIDRYYSKIDCMDQQGIEATRLVTATMMRQIHEGNERAAIDLLLHDLEASTGDTDQPGTTPS